MDVEPYARGFQAINNNIPVIPPPHHQVPIADPPEGLHHAHHQAQPVYAMASVH